MWEFFDLDYFRDFFSFPRKKRLLENFLSLSSLQVISGLLSLITLPYLVRVLGPEKFGLVAFAQAFIQYFIIFTDYGFNLSATREISIHREKKEKISEIFSSVIIVKFLLGILGFILLLLILALVPKFRVNWAVYIFTFGLVLANILLSFWFFLGMEKMKYIAFLNIVAKAIFLICMFIFIRKASDYLYVPLINSSGYLIAGILGLGIIFKGFGVKFTLPRIESIKHQLKEGWHIFISTTAGSLRIASNAFILGLFTNNTIVGYYSAVEKIIMGIQKGLQPIPQVVYPYVSKLAVESKKRAVSFIKKIVALAGSVTFVISLLIFTLAGPIVNIFLGNQYKPSIIILRILAFLPFITVLSNIFVFQGLAAFRLQRLISKFIVPIAISHLFLLIVLVYFYSLIGAAAAIIITQIVILVFSIKYFSKFVLKKA